MTMSSRQVEVDGEELSDRQPVYTFRARIVALHCWMDVLCRFGAGRRSSASLLDEVKEARVIVAQDRA
jgi:hypothetical protein